MSQKSPKGRKRTSAKANAAAADEGTWDCSVCTFKNNAEAFKCAMCDVRKGTSTRKPRINQDLVAAQHAQALTPPPPAFPVVESSTSGSVPSPVPSSSKSEVFDPPPEEEEPEPEPSVAVPTPSPSPSASKVTKKASTSTTKKSETKKTQNKARLKNVDRSSATYHSVTVDDFTVVITEFKPKVKKEREKKEKISNGNNNGDNNDKKDKKEDFGQGPSRNGTNSFDHASNNKDTKSQSSDSASNGNFNDPTSKGGGGSSNASLNHENGVNSRLTVDTSRSS